LLTDAGKEGLRHWLAHVGNAALLAGLFFVAAMTVVTWRHDAEREQAYLRKEAEMVAIYKKAIGRVETLQRSEVRTVNKLVKLEEKLEGIMKDRQGGYQQEPEILSRK
jgi:hypothetical protein